MDVDEGLLSQIMTAYEGTSGYVGVLNVLVITLCVKLVLDSDNPDETLKQLETAVRNTVREAILGDPHSVRRNEIWKSHQHAAEFLLGAIRNHADLGDANRPSE